jgi:hypothetical protein
LAACISVPTLILLGTFFGYKLPALKSEVREVTHLIVVCAAVLAIVAAGLYLHHHQKKVLAKAHLDDGIEAALPEVPGAGPRPQTSSQHPARPNEEAA